MIAPFWFFLACAVAMVGGGSAAEWFDRRRRSKSAKACLAVTVTASSVIFAKGAMMAHDWSNPFAGKTAEMARAVHSPRGGMVAGILTVWPYAMMAAGAFFGVVGAIVLWRTMRRSA